MNPDRGARRGDVAPLRLRRALAWLPLLNLLAACSAVAPLATLLPPEAPRRVELTDTPFFPQEDHQCGPAALATLLVASGVPTIPGDLAPESYLPGRQGSLQAELLAAARRRGRLAYVLAGEPAALAGELTAGRPVLVLQNLGVDAFPFWHYAVLVGIDASREEVVLRSGRREREILSWARFIGSWQRGGSWAVVLLRPGTMPASPDLVRYLQAAAGLEAAGRLDDAAASFAAAAAQWEDAPLAWLALGNNAYARGALGGAIGSFRRGVALAPRDPVLRNNLAQALLDAGCPRLAEPEVRTAAKLAAGTPLEADVRATEAAVTAGLARDATGATCAPGVADGEADKPLSSANGQRPAVTGP